MPDRRSLHRTRQSAPRGRSSASWRRTRRADAPPPPAGWSTDAARSGSRPVSGSWAGAIGMRESRAIVFDLDDTLYPYRAFVRSGFAAAAAHIAEATGVPARRVYRALCRASAAARGRELQRVCERYGIAEATIPRLVHLMKWHTPAIRLPRETRQVLLRLQAAWRIGILTNGEPAIQRRKLAALGLPPLVDAAVCAAECGTGRGKPDGEAFAAVVDRLGVAPERSVFVGDDPEAD